MNESVFTYAAPGLKFGRGASAEIGWDVMRYGRHDDVAAIMLGMIEQLLGIIAHESGMTRVAFWRMLMLAEQGPA